MKLRNKIPRREAHLTDAAAFDLEASTDKTSRLSRCRGLAEDRRHGWSSPVYVVFRSRGSKGPWA